MTRFSGKIIIFCLISLVAVISYSISQEILNSGEDCIKCHDPALGPQRNFVHPLIREHKCRACHIDYDAEEHIEGDKPQIDVCAGCHPEENLGRSHPIGSGITDPNTNDTMTCVSTCHRMHGTDFKQLVPFKNNMELCLSCHEDF
ncbi:MAG: hypothetical protein COV72_02580 [Candidatus Omnitrophica bacterium CG11_big_fil_rev_8_21_14_0_20_42_13]|uniref:Doubled CXXCH motif domain-containing protein n=1 Tax=Candidatus Ghiorseimicrobium undicola TaxID=1974746 RepID=A0A2H0LYL9_9BACT|nr:MAG: hypothetical protein COV72_02580 [Candidatus Omnitrophica bacterium CG11_big_fil_rev_8_21_14_0_20_42_13]